MIKIHVNSVKLKIVFLVSLIIIAYNVKKGPFLIKKQKNVKNVKMIVYLVLIIYKKQKYVYNAQ